MSLPEPRALVRARHLVGLALDEARRAPCGDVPIGAVIVDASGAVVAAAANRRQADGNPLAHAEVLAIAQAVGRLGHADGWRLEGMTLAVTVEPCAMCAGAILNARMAEVVFGAYEPKTGAAGSVIDVLRDPVLPHVVAVTGGIRQDECARLVQDFFAARRRASEQSGVKPPADF